MQRYEAIIIGFGKGGKTLAAALAKQGLQVAMVEQSKMMYGGTCINIGCIPTKALIHHSKDARLQGFNSFEEKEAAYRKAIDKKTKLTDDLRKKNFDNLDTKDKITVYTGKASFIDPHVISVQTDEGAESIYGEKIYINTGASAVVPGIEGVESSQHVYTSTTLMELTSLPEKLLIIGGGYIGLEFASMYAGFGSEVIILDEHETLIPREDRDIALAVQQTLEKRGVQFHLNVTIQSIQDRAQGAVVTILDSENKLHEVEGDAILLATGRKPNTEGLFLNHAGVDVTEKGAIQVNDRLQTNVPHIYALGDVVGGPQFTYISLDDHRILYDQLFGNKQRTTTDRMHVPYTVFIDPPLSRVGWTEAEAVAKGYDIKVAVLPVPAIPRARLMEETEGMLKAVVDANTNQILGCTLFCADSQEIINTVRLAIVTGQEYTFLRDFMFTHPTMSEALNDLFQI